VLFVLDYSTSMNIVANASTMETRYESVRRDIREELVKPNSFLRNAKLSLLRFGHDPNPTTPGTTIAGETTGITDGQAVDVLWTAETYTCGAASLIESLATTPPPMNGGAFGIGTWTKGAMDRGVSLITADRAAFPSLAATRRYVVVVITDGEWTNANGTTPLSPASEDPGLTAQQLFGVGVQTWVVEISGSPGSKAAADALAAAGGTGQAYSSLANLQQHLGAMCQ
jgi:hypothetical protein